MAGAGGAGPGADAVARFDPAHHRAGPVAGVAMAGGGAGGGPGIGGKPYGSVGRSSAGCGAGQADRMADPPGPPRAAGAPGCCRPMGGPGGTPQFGPPGRFGPPGQFGPPGPGTGHVGGTEETGGVRPKRRKRDTRFPRLRARGSNCTHRVGEHPVGEHPVGERSAACCVRRPDGGADGVAATRGGRDQDASDCMSDVRAAGPNATTVSDREREVANSRLSSGAARCARVRSPSNTRGSARAFRAATPHGRRRDPRARRRCPAATMRRSAG